MKFDRESWFVAIAVAVLVVSLAAAAVAATDGSGSDGHEATVEGWTPDVGDVDDAEPPTEPGVATVGDREYDSLQAAIDAAKSGETIALEGQFDERVTVETADLTLEATGEGASIDGGGEDTVVHIAAENVTLDGVWVRESGHERSNEDAAVHVNGSGSTLSDVRITETTYGVWIGEAEDVTVADATIVGREDVPETERGNGIHLDRADGAELHDNRITTVRDGIYFSWSEEVVASGNAMWDLRYGVHYMYSDDNRLEDNVAFDNDVGYALMVSQNLTIVNNTAVNNDGPSGQGILVKGVDYSEIRGNAVVANGNGFYVYNAHGNDIVDNLVLENEVGVQFTAGSSDERVVGNSFIANGQSAYAPTNAQIHWNDTDRGNYWSDARPLDLDGDGTSETRHQPAGTVERLVHEQPQAAVFAESAAFDAVRMAESSFPVLESPGVVDHRPLAESPHDEWREYYANHDY
ncbi:nitrous oxide reductase family maturation protein NosD [Natrarchaeobius chitinivorans]|uniref:Nitrous oxide reductase family maturation protein NosD n=1 Tax=Natrarchaeobius chitinivorans TaxID=1679083 RepID=A0A3N6LVQ1_NATCH|nr:nitrous oxide reductase family maturation protein NosD [Natrarchaeobius chitinivorans]RQG91814.1 nitrous oxide reductase family maturation protein NosD [Natrarchaeobius chitinivorans]